MTHQTAPLVPRSSPLRPGTISVPGRIELDQDVLRWNVVDPDTREKKAPTDLLERFVHLSDADPKRILDFARKWGVLGICEQHGLPHTHNPGYATNGQHGCWPQGWPGECWEPIEKWRSLARRFAACLRLAVAIDVGKKGEFNDWQVAQHSDVPQNLAQARQWLSWDVGGWVVIGQVIPEMQYKGGAWVLEHYAHGVVNLFGTLAYRLMIAVARTDGLATCCACGESYVIAVRRPNPDRRNYCRKCGKAAADRDAARDYRRRKKQREANAKKTRSR